MKALLIALMLCTSCVATYKSPVFHIEYTGKIDKQGLSINARPPFWKYCCDLYNWITD